MKASRFNLSITEAEHAHYVAISAKKGFTSFSAYVRSLCEKDEASTEENRSVADELRGIRVAVEKIADALPLTGSDAVESAKEKLAATLGTSASKQQKQA